MKAGIVVEKCLDFVEIGEFELSDEGVFFAFV